MEQDVEKVLEVIHGLPQFKSRSIEEEARLNGIISDLLKSFILTPHEDFAQRNLAFHNMKFGIFKKALEDDEIQIYLTMWDGTWDAWKRLTDEPIGPHEFIEIDTVILQYIERRKAAIQAKGKPIDMNAGTPGFIIQQLLNAGLKVIKAFWPQTRPKRKKVVKVEKPVIVVTKPKRMKVYCVGGKTMTKQQYNAWYKELPKGERAYFVDKVVTKLVDIDSIKAKKGSK